MLIHINKLLHFQVMSNVARNRHREYFINEQIVKGNTSTRCWPWTWIATMAVRWRAPPPVLFVFFHFLLIFYCRLFVCVYWQGSKNAHKMPIASLSNRSIAHLFEQFTVGMDTARQLISMLKSNMLSLLISFDHIRVNQLSNLWSPSQINNTKQRD